ncbi:PREDICTED: uncharacterized protein LOC104705805 isoform X1 [Camelina sativa]|uniref:Uncharacterized protein LOC104705805 isoform X1 n=2 Tax=Camelina sativa TaxID=90675 RepID=A0ABM0T337_CAMSA|nr:PREDICTED: uncharacterized protein LOC104705805 isoform X1 [Camelina sativa]
MGDYRDIVAGLSSVGDRVKVRRRSSSSVDSSMSLRNVSLEVKLLQNNPPSVFKEDDVLKLKTTYNLPSSVNLRLPLPSERAADAKHGEVVVYELYFAAGLREVIPSLIAKVAKRFAISPGQLYPSAWRLLTAIQTFGELESITIGVEEVLCAYFLLKIDTDPGRYSLHTRNHPPLAVDFEGHSRRTLEEGWRERYVFMKVGDNPGFPTSWFVAGVSSKANLAFRDGALEVVKHPLLYRSVEFLTSKFALENSSIWGFNMSYGQRSSTSNAFAKFMAASGKLAEANPSSSGDEVQFLGDLSTHKRKTHDDTANSSEARRLRTVQTVAVLSPSSELVSSSTTSMATEELRCKILTHNFESLVDIGTNSTIDSVYTDLLKAMSSFHLVDKKLSSEHQINENLRRELDNEKSRTDFAHKTIAAKSNEISSLEAKVQELDQTILDLQASGLDLLKEKELLQQEITVLRKRVDVLKNELEFFLNGAAIIAGWEALRECLLGEHKKWKLDEVEEQYRTVMRSQALFKGMPPPIFEESLASIQAQERANSGQGTSDPTPP